jgi:geranylgeranyl transferase type-2 subunit beta
MSYLDRLALRLAAGAMHLADTRRCRHAAYLAGLQNGDGGFPGRQGPSDLYYTAFALRGLALTGGLAETIARRAGPFLERRLAESLSAIDFVSLVQAAVVLEAAAGLDVFRQAGMDRRQAVLERLEPLRREDGGYAKTPQGRASSTYQTFLVASCLDLLGLSLDSGDRMIALVRSRQRADGGFVELDRSERGAVNPTAAAVGLLRLLGHLDEPTQRSATAFLLSMVGPEGGFHAHARTPVADLLSTFTGLVALVDLDALAAIDRPAVCAYVAAREHAEGGFSAGCWDAGRDAEYTFYGLGAEAILRSVGDPA